MKLFTLAALLLLFSCRTAKVIPLKGNYEKTPVIYTSEKPVNEIWDNLIDLFAQRGLPIKFTDKNSGLIISDNMALTATWEDKNGTLLHPDANIVVRKIYNVAANAVLPETRSGTLKKSKQPDECRAEWNVRLKANGSGTSININLVHVQYERTQSTERRGADGLYQYGSRIVWVNLDYFETTGTFERMIYEKIK